MERSVHQIYTRQRLQIYKIFWIGNVKSTGGVGILLAEKWVENIHDIKRISDRIMLLKLLIGNTVFTVLSVYAPQFGLDDSIKDTFYDNLQLTVSGLSAD